jgi:hypothetical protein
MNAPSGVVALARGCGELAPLSRAAERMRACSNVQLSMWSRTA